MESAASLPAVIIIDDEPDDRFFAERTLRRLGVKNPVRTFADGPQFMEFVRAETTVVGEDGRIAVCVVFIDLRMPPPDGFEILQWMRTQPALSHVQVVVLTNSVDPKDMRRAAELRADLYLPKFPSDETLARVVSKASASAAQALRLASVQ
jgi:CheY-like chemotaxis protein